MYKQVNSNHTCPWGKITTIFQYMTGVSRVTTKSGEGFRIAIGILKKYAVDIDFLLSKAEGRYGDRVYFKGDSQTSLFLFDCPEILRRYAKKNKLDENDLFDKCKLIVEKHYPDYFLDS